jgi:hypothetical protein
LSAMTIVGFGFLSVSGIFIPSVSIYQVLAVFTLGIDFPKYYLFRRFGL